MGRGGGIGGSLRANTRTGKRPFKGNDEFSGGRPKPGEDGDDMGANFARTFEEISRKNEIDLQMGFPPYVTGPPRMGWMLNMQPTLVRDGDWPSGRSAVDYYFMAEDGCCFKATLLYSPYFFIKCRLGSENEVEEYLRRRFGNVIESSQRVMKEDLDVANHLAGLRRKYLRLYFRNVNDLMAVRKVLLPIAIKNGEGYKDGVFTTATDEDAGSGVSGRKSEANTLSNIVGLREYDLPYHLRVGIDLDIRVGLWYTVTPQGPTINLTRLDKDVRPDPVILAFDIETSKMPLKFPDAAQDHIMMISYMINGQGHLIVNRDIISQDIEDFEYTPKPDFPGLFTVVNVPDEQALLQRFFTHIQLVRPQVFVSYNGDFFDWPFIETRASVYGMSMGDMIGITKNSQGEYGCTYGAHMDCICWVKRDSYLPAGSHGLKSVCSVKLGYDPLELDPELMTPLASSDPQTLANYSVSDAVATYYLYMKYVHPFIFSLCNIIPLAPDEVLRKGTGTLCETLLMAKAFHANVIMPNKHEEPKERFHKGHLLDSETYIGGHVEALEAGVYRSDFQYRFKINPATMQQLITDLDRALTFFIQHESHMRLDDVKNYDQVKAEIAAMLNALGETPVKMDNPLIYHLDVGSMYPNIILTNRLQPSAMVEESTCAVCDFNRPGKQCQRKMTWSWRGEFFSAKQSEYKMILKQLEGERFPSRQAKGTTIPFHALSAAEQTALIKKRLGDYSQKVYKRTRQSETVQKTAIVCQRENSFYIDTVRNFRDRRYDYKNLQKVWKKKMEEAQAAKDPARIEEAGKLLVLYDSLQLAHKCILNSFYGYVMRKAARWYSMEMGGIVCETGAAIITLARQLIEQFGRPLELDTDGIWCMLPSGFPQNFSFELANGKKLSFAYPCVMLNHLLFDRFTNHQYQTLTDPLAKTYAISSENSIFFEIDGPYKAMVLPSSTEEGRQLKKRYAVFNEDGTLAELKGFEIKRRGELKLIKIFQSQIFKTFLGGSNLAECYGEVATVANYWLDILYSRGASLEDTELIDLISENRSMSKSLEDYGEQKSTSISTAKRLAEFLGDQMVKDKGLACKFIISAKPHGLPVTNRAIPVAIFSAAPEVRRHYLGRWLKDSAMADADIRDIIDWDYYVERLGNMVQKLIVIPAAMQHVSNPVPRLIPPEWLKRHATGRGGGLEQRKLTDMFAMKKTSTSTATTTTTVDDSEIKMIDIEDVGSSNKKKSIKSLFASKPSVSGEIKEDTELSLTEVKAALPAISFESNYVGWVESRKVYWKQLHNQLREVAMNTAVAPASGSLAKRAKFTSWLEQDRETLLQTPWQIISIEEIPGKFGEFRLWALVGSVLRHLRLVVPRRFYFSTKIPLEGDALGGAVKVHHRLPNGGSAANLYEVTMDETTYHNTFLSNSAALLDPMLESLWEMDIPLAYHVLLKVGCVGRVNRKIKSPAPSDDFLLDELEFVSTSQVPYLSHPVQSVQYAFIGHLQAESRQVMMLALPGVPSIRFFIVDPGMHRQLTAVKSLFSSTAANASLEWLKVSPDQVEFEVDYYGDWDSAFKSLNRAVNIHLDTRPKPTIFLIHSRQHAIFDLGHRVPTLSFSLARQSPYVLPPLDWQRGGARRLFEVIQGIDSWVADRLTLARFAHLPLGNLPSGQDQDLFVADVFFCRLLRAGGYLLPWNNTPEQSVTQPRGHLIDCAGVYTNVTVDFELSNMAINALLEYPSLTPDGEQTPPLLAMLRSLVTNWLRESLSHANPMASRLVECFFRWLRSGASLILPSDLLDRLLLSMDRALDRLHGHLRQLGCTIVHSNGHRLLIATAKSNHANAEAFVAYLLADLKNTDGLAWITLHPSTYWQTLLWMDSANYAGFIAIPETGDFTIDESKEEPVSLRWNLAEYLPPMLVRPFQVLVAEYLTLVHRRPRKSIACLNEEEDKAQAETKSEGRATMKIRNYSLLNESDLVDDETPTTAGSSEEIPIEYQHRFLAMVRDIKKAMTGLPANATDAARRSFPLRVGSHLTGLDDGPIHFVKFLGAVLNSDTSASGAVFKLIKSAYALLGVGEFSEITTFVDPCRTFILPNVICAQCNYVRDLDFCRDLDILTVMNTLVKSSSSTSLRPHLPCPCCHTNYDLSQLEREIIHHTQSRILHHQQQDLICMRCKSVKAENMPLLCSCSGKYRWEASPDALLKDLHVLMRISAALRLDSLKLFITSLRLISI